MDGNTGRFAEIQYLLSWVSLLVQNTDSAFQKQ